MQHCTVAGSESVESGHMRKLNLSATFIALFGLILSVSGAMAQTKTVSKTAQPILNTTTSSKKIPQRLEAKAWSIPINFEMASSVHEHSAYERSAQEILNIAPNYKINSQWGLGALATIYRDDSNGESGHGQSGVGNTLVSVGHSQSMTPTTTWKNKLSGTLATDVSLRDTTSFQGAVRVGSGVSFTNLWNGSSFSYMLSFNRNVHEFDMTAVGGFNIRETVGNTVDFNLPIYGPLSLQTNFNYTLGQTYKDDMRTKFSFNVGLGYDFAKNFSASVGTSNEANALGYNGRDSNIEFFNSNTSVISFGLTYIL